METIDTAGRDAAASSSEGARAAGAGATSPRRSAATPQAADGAAGPGTSVVDCTAVSVALRVRPLVGSELIEGCKDCMKLPDSPSGIAAQLHENQVCMGKDRKFTYDHVFGTRSSQEHVFSTCVKPLVDACFAGYNATVLAYGQTGSGKTHTMGSGGNVTLSPEELGIIPRVISYAFDTIKAKQAAQPGASFCVKVQFIEIYGEEIKDLLDPRGSSERQLAIRETDDGGVQLINAKEELVECEDELLRALERGSLSRTTGSTRMNASSSRSHAIFTVVLEQSLPVASGSGADAERASGNGEAGEEDDGEGAGVEKRVAKFHFVDLAGSERAKRTQATGQRMKEGIQINRGLLALGNVISALGDEKKRGKVHVPYRDSKLTRMLQDSLGGNSRTLMIACVSPADVNFEETLNTLKYANRARNIKNKPVVNKQRSTSAQITALQQEVEMLRQQLAASAAGGGGAAVSSMAFSAATSITATLGVTPDDIEEMQRRLDAAVARSEEAEKDNRRLNEKVKEWKREADLRAEAKLHAESKLELLSFKYEEATGESAAALFGEQEGSADEGAPEAKDGEEDSSAGVTMSAILKHRREVNNLQEQLKKVNDELATARKQLEAAAQGALPDLDSDEDDAPCSDDDDDGEIEDLEQDDPEMAALNRRMKARRKEEAKDAKSLAEDIKEKAAAIARTKALEDNVRKLYESKMLEMDAKVRQTTEERDRLLNQIRDVEKDAAAADKKTKLRQLQRKLRDTEKQLTALRDKQRDYDKLKRMHAKMKRAVSQKEAELDTMRRQRVEKARAYEAERKRDRAELDARRKEVMRLRRLGDRTQARIKKLEQERTKKESVLRRKNEELVLAQRRARQSKLTSRTSKLNAQQKKMALRLEKAVRAVEEREEQNEKLRARLKQRENDVKMMEVLLAEREKVARGIAGGDGAKSHSVAEADGSGGENPADMTFDFVDDFFGVASPVPAVAESSAMTPPPPPPGPVNRATSMRDMLISPAPKRVAAAAAGAASAPGGDSTSAEGGVKLGAAGSGRRSLTQDEADLLQELDEKIDGTRARIEYNDGEIADLQLSKSARKRRPGSAADDGAGDDDEEDESIAGVKSLPDAKDMMRALFHMLVDYKGSAKLQEAELEAMQLKLKEAEGVAEERERHVQLVREDYERRMAALEREFSTEKEHLVHLLANQVEDEAETEPDTEDEADASAASPAAKQQTKQRRPSLSRSPSTREREYAALLETQLKRLHEAEEAKVSAQAVATDLRVELDEAKHSLAVAQEQLRLLRLAAGEVVQLSKAKKDKKVRSRSRSGSGSGSAASGEEAAQDVQKRRKVSRRAGRRRRKERSSKGDDAEASTTAVPANEPASLERRAAVEALAADARAVSQSSGASTAAAPSAPTPTVEEDDEFEVAGDAEDIFSRAHSSSLTHRKATEAGNAGLFRRMSAYTQRKSQFGGAKEASMNPTRVGQAWSSTLRMATSRDDSDVPTTSAMRRRRGAAGSQDPGRSEAQPAWVNRMTDPKNFTGTHAHRHATRATDERERPPTAPASKGAAPRKEKDGYSNVPRPRTAAGTTRRRAVEVVGVPGVGASAEEGDRRDASASSRRSRSRRNKSASSTSDGTNKEGSVDDRGAAQCGLTAVAAAHAASKGADDGNRVTRGKENASKGTESAVLETE